MNRPPLVLGWSGEPSRSRLHLALAVACLASLVLCFCEGWSRAPHKMDFYGYYLPSRIWLSGGNPYDRAVFTAQARILNPEVAQLGEISCPLLPCALTIFAPLAILSYSAAARVLWTLNFAALLFSFWAMNRLWARDWSLAERLVIATLLPQSRLIQSLAYRGQPSLLMLAAILAAVLATRRQPRVAGAALAIVLAKFTLALPIAGLWLWNRDWRSLRWGAILAAFLSVVPLVTIRPAILVSTFLDSLRLHEQLNRKDLLPYHVTTWSAIYSPRLGADSPLVPAISVLLLVIGATSIVWAFRHTSRSGAAQSWKFAALTAFGTVSIYHRVYDAVVLFPVVVLAWQAWRSPRTHKPVTVIGLGVALALLIFVLSPQSVAERLSLWLARHDALSPLRAVNAWLALAVALFTVLVGRGLVKQDLPADRPG